MEYVWVPMGHHISFAPTFLVSTFHEVFHIKNVRPHYYHSAYFRLYSESYLRIVYMYFLHHSCEGDKKSTVPL